MSTIVYLSNQFVQAVEVKGSRSYAVCQEMTPEGSIINGIVTDEDTFIDFIRRFFIKNKLSRKDCTLVISSSQITTKMLELPKAGSADMNKMIAREFSDRGADEMLYVYHPMETEDTGKMQKILAAAVDRRFVKTYVELFAQAGIEVIAMEPAVINFTRRFMEEEMVEKQNCIVQVHDGMEVISILFVDGIYLFSQRNRILADESKETFAREAEALVQGLLQFAASQKLEKPITRLIVCGQNQKELLEVMSSSSEFSDLIELSEYHSRKERLKVKSTSGSPVEYVYALGSEKPEKTLNFIWKMHHDSVLSRKRRERILTAMPAIIAAVVCLVLTAVLTASYSEKKHRLESLQKELQLSDKTNTSYDLMEANVTRMEKQIEDTELLWNNLMTYPTLSTEVKQVLEKASGSYVTVSVMDFNRDTGLLTVEAYSKEARNISGFVEKLQDLPEFHDVEYSGYTYDKTQDNYRIQIVCVMAEGVGR